MNVGSRFIRASFTGTRGVSVSAVSSAGVDGPASCLGVRGSMGVGNNLDPASYIHCGIEVAISGMPTDAAENSVGKRQNTASGPAGRANPAGGIPAISNDDFAAAPSLLVLQQSGEFG